MVHVCFSRAVLEPWDQRTNFPLLVSADVSFSFVMLLFKLGLKVPLPYLFLKKNDRNHPEMTMVSVSISEYDGSTMSENDFTMNDHGLSEATMDEFGTGRSMPWNIYQVQIRVRLHLQSIRNRIENLGDIHECHFFWLCCYSHLDINVVSWPSSNTSFSQILRFITDEDAALGSGAVRKLENPQRLSASYAADLSVVMPGEQNPTYIAQLLPSLPKGRHLLASP
ncbi:hypothetical protein F3Y22_tig00112928pilonHSYRG00048 [Hibiscus syriacus]|uniref:Uncharacterized protein n=1 Tax=Hibiscus syriacus TaxID=106335 RepID=A0A6A2X8Q1_HIBSY|nr:hypothetical protein F3Y22_tig00112928pilonHSYRG00048 [Hibiscus syriacus]